MPPLRVPQILYFEFRAVLTGVQAGLTLHLEANKNSWAQKEL
jgi:hypothetical protein